MQVKSIAECSKGSILQYLWPSLSYHLVATLDRFYCIQCTILTLLNIALRKDSDWVSIIYGGLDVC